MIKAPKQTQHESKDSKAFRPKKRTPAESGAQPMAGILWLQRTVGNRAVQRIVAEAQRESAHTGVIQRHLAPGMLALGLRGIIGVQKNASLLGATAPQMQGDAGQAQVALLVSDAYTPKGTGSKEIVVPPAGGI